MTAVPYLRRPDAKRRSGPAAIYEPCPAAFRLPDWNFRPSDQGGGGAGGPTDLVKAARNDRSVNTRLCFREISISGTYVEHCFRVPRLSDSSTGPGLLAPCPLLPVTFLVRLLPGSDVELDARLGTNELREPRSQFGETKSTASILLLSCNLNFWLATILMFPKR